MLLLRREVIITVTIMITIITIIIIFKELGQEKTDGLLIESVQIIFYFNLVDFHGLAEWINSFEVV